MEKGQTSDVPSMFLKEQGNIKNFFSLHKRLSVYSTSEVDGGSSIIGLGLVQDVMQWYPCRGPLVKKSDA